MPCMQRLGAVDACSVHGGWAEKCAVCGCVEPAACTPYLSAAAWVLSGGLQVDAAESSRGCAPLTAAICRAASLSGASAAQPQPEPGAAAAPFLRCAKLLLEAGASPLHASKDGSTAVHAAAEAGFLPGLHLLLGWQPRSGSNAHDAMHIEGVSNGSASVDSTSLLESEDLAGRSPLARAAAGGRAQHRECILFLLNRGAAVGSPDLVRVMPSGAHG